MSTPTALSLVPGSSSLFLPLPFSYSLSLSLPHSLFLSLSRSRARISVLLAFHLELAIPSRFVNGFIYNYRASRSRITLDKYHRKGEGYENPRPMKPTGLGFNNAPRNRLLVDRALILRRLYFLLLPASSTTISSSSSSRRPTDRPTVLRTYVFPFRDFHGARNFRAAPEDK